MSDPNAEQEDERKRDEEGPALNIALTSVVLILLMVVLGVLTLLVRR